jgi:hypothetical protein
MVGCPSNHLNLRNQMRYSRRYRAAASSRSQVLMVAGSRNQSEEKTPAKSTFAGVLFLYTKSPLNNINHLDS